MGALLRKGGERQLGTDRGIHAGMKVGGSPRTFHGGTRPGEATAMDVAELARRFPAVPLICGHAGGDWEAGTRAVRGTLAKVCRRSSRGRGRDIVSRIEEDRP